MRSLFKVAVAALHDLLPPYHVPKRRLMRRRVRRALHRARLRTLITAASLIGGMIGGCIAPAQGGNTSAQPTESAVGETPAFDPSLEGGWSIIAPGLERRTLRPGGNYPFTHFVALRVDPAQYNFRAHYRPGEPLYASEWRDLLPNAQVIINANFFDPQGRALGLIVVDGVAYGQSYAGFGGFLQVQNGQVRVRSNITEPYTGEPFEQAVQGYPVLVTDGAASFANTRGDRVSRRTVIAQDRAGRIIVLVTSSFFGMRLVDLSAYLPTTDLDLQTAVNLDGGGSTFLLLTGDTAQTVPSLDPVPAVLAIYPR